MTHKIKEEVCISSTSHCIIIAGVIDNFQDDIKIEHQRVFNNKEKVYESTVTFQMTHDEAEELYKTLGCQLGYLTGEECCDEDI